jgi:hypothetical protein
MVFPVIVFARHAWVAVFLLNVFDILCPLRQIDALSGFAGE